MIQQKQLKALVLAGFLGVMTLALVGRKAAMNGSIMIQMVLCGRVGWEPLTARTIIWI